MKNLTRVTLCALACVTIVGSLATVAAAKKPKPKATPQIVVTASPNPVVETNTSSIQTIIQVEARPQFAGDFVTISSTQLDANCQGGVLFSTEQAATATFTSSSVTLNLDNDGNATVAVLGVSDCAPGTDLFDASLDAPPFATAVTKLVVEPPQVTPPGVKGYPANEVETGDGGQGPLSASDVETIFMVETSPVYAEQTATLTSDQLFFRCGLDLSWLSLTPAVSITNTITGPIDNDGNTSFSFQGASCAAGKSVVIAEIGGGGPTYSTQYNILPPAVTI